MRLRVLLKRAFITRSLKPTRIIILTFIGLIVAGALLLTLPIATNSGKSCGIMTALFTSTSAICVTGLTIVSTEAYWSFFGQAVILFLCQVGGLGLMSIIAIFYFMLNKKIGLSERLVMMESMNLSEIEGVVALAKRVIFGTLFFEATGAIILSACFMPEFGLLGGIWRGIFMSVSSFCNAGFTIVYSIEYFSTTTAFDGNPIILITMMILIILGSIGFYVWGDVYKNRNFKKLHLHSKLTIITTGILIVLGAVVYLTLETGEGGCLHALSSGKKILVSLFQSVSDRTAGFDAAGHMFKSDETKLLTLMFMFIGGSSGSAAGGVKTVTIAILFLSLLSTLRGRQDLIIFKRKISQTQVIQAATLVIIGLGISIIGGVVISTLNNFTLIDSLFETVSAYSTAGISVGITELSGVFTQLIFIVFMFFGKIGILSISIAFMMRRRRLNSYTYPTEHVIIG